MTSSDALTSEPRGRYYYGYATLPSGGRPREESGSMSARGAHHGLEYMPLH